VSSALASIARLHIVAIGALGTLTWGWGLTGRYLPLLALLSACDWFVVNLLNRVVDLDEDLHNRIPGADVVARHRRRTIVAGLLVLGFSLVVSVVWAPQTLAPRLAFHVLGVCYNWRLLPLPSGRRRIKELAFWKNTASATGFLLTCFALPLVSAPLAPDVDVIAVLIAGTFFVLFELSYEVLYDLRDVEGDRFVGVKTWPVLLGPRGGAAVAVGQMVAAVVVAVVGAVAGALPWHLAVMAAAPLLQLAIVGPRLPDRVTSSLCVGITWFGAFLLAAYHVWEALGLPGHRGLPS
jgi:4-hydroxybenzoate polyprenyltransferase